MPLVFDLTQGIKLSYAQAKDTYAVFPLALENFDSLNLALASLSARYLIVFEEMLSGIRN